MGEGESSATDRTVIGGLVGKTDTKRYFQTVVENTSDAVIAIDDGGEIVYANRAVERLFGYAPAELIGEPVTMLMPERYRSKHEEAFTTYLQTGERTVNWNCVEFPGRHRDGREIELSISFREMYRDGGRLFTGFIRNITRREEQEEELKRQHNELERLKRINAMIRDINRCLVEATDRDEMLTDVCEHLTTDDQYVFAWVGKLDLADERVRPITRSGDGQSYLDEITVSVADSAAEGPAGITAQTESMQVVNDVAEDPAVGPWREAALDRGYRSVAGIPIMYDSTLYGVLLVYAGSPYVFDEREQSVLSELGESIGHAINAFEQQRMLTSDTHLQLEFRANGIVPADVVPDEQGIDVSVHRTVPGAAGAVIQYVSTADSFDAETLAAVFGNIAPVKRIQQMSEQDGERLFEITYVDPPVSSAIRACGGRITSAEISGTVLHVVAELPQSADVRSVVESVRAEFPDAKLVAQRSITYDRDAVEEHWMAVDTDLTDRQRTVLESAFFGGYFDRPRESTGEELSESLGVSPSTFHQHLQAGLRKVLARIFEDNG